MTRGEGWGGGGGWDCSLMEPAWKCSGGVGAGTSDCQGVEAPNPSSSREKDTQRKQGPEDDRNRSSTQGGRRDTETRRAPKATF